MSGFFPRRERVLAACAPDASSVYLGQIWPRPTFDAPSVMDTLSPYNFLSLILIVTYIRGLFSHENDHAEAVVDLACDILIALDLLLKEEYSNHPHFAHISVRVGINTGPVVAGVIGLDRFLYGMHYVSFLIIIRS